VEVVMITSHKTVEIHNIQ